MPSTLRFSITSPPWSRARKACGLEATLGKHRLKSVYVGKTDCCLSRALDSDRIEERFFIFCDRSEHRQRSTSVGYLIIRMIPAPGIVQPIKGLRPDYTLDTFKFDQTIRQYIQSRSCVSAIEATKIAELKWVMAGVAGCKKRELASFSAGSVAKCILEQMLGGLNYIRVHSVL